MEAVPLSYPPPKKNLACVAGTEKGRGRGRGKVQKGGVNSLLSLIPSPFTLPSLFKQATHNKLLLPLDCLL